MWVFWIVTGLLAAASAALVLVRAGAAARMAAQGGDDPALPVYRRQLTELDEAAAQGVLGPEEHRAARAEAGRRLLRSADAGVRAERTGGRGSRFAAVLAVAGAAALALCGYILLGRPGMGDEPYAARLAGWRRADPSSLDAARMSAVLRDIAKARPHDPRVYDYLGRAELASGDAFDAARAFATAAALAPDHADLFASEGEAQVQDAQGKVTPQAAAAFRQALKLDPTNATSRFYLALAQVTAGDRAGGVTAWRALAADLPPDDPRRSSLLAEIAHVQGGAAEGEPPGPASTGPGPSAPVQAEPQAAFIQAMVSRQAAELQAHPDDAQGWARLVRSYGVLGDAAAQQRALAQARRVFVGRPAALGPIEAAASRPR